MLVLETWDAELDDIYDLNDKKALEKCSFSFSDTFTNIQSFPK